MSYRGRIPDPSALAGLPGDPFSVAQGERSGATMSMVRRALAEGRTMLAWQPVVEAANPGTIAFHEGLIRVLDEGGRVIPARDFMAAAETSEAGRLLDCASLDHGLRALAAAPDLRLSINMSARSIGYPRWRRLLDSALSDDPALGVRLILEITECSTMLVPEIVGSFMADLQRRGVAFALDDFGAGFTSFRYLRDFYFDIVKIDGQFIRGVADSPDDQILTQAMVGIARQFDMFVVAESVETAADAAWLAAAGVDCLQGYFFGAPTVQPPWQAKGGRSA
jgi:EAL domain-containing protein (putative c-di-GMP-specific phosphodiesterase class I)